jgi:aldehyde:ferredoxin oxidoreductase
MNGYAGKFLEVDLTKGSCSILTIEEAKLKKFIGGVWISFLHDKGLISSGDLS